MGVENVERQCYVARMATSVSGSEQTTGGFLSRHVCSNHNAGCLRMSFGTAIAGRISGADVVDAALQKRRLTRR